MNFFQSNTTPMLALQAQERLLRHFLRQSRFEAKTTSTHELNYVVIQSNHHKKKQQHVQHIPPVAVPQVATDRDRQKELWKDHVYTPTTTTSTSTTSVGVAQKDNKKKKTLVLMHGFGLGLGFFYDNYDELSQHFDKVIAVDWLGMGCSSRTSTRLTRLSMIPSLTHCQNKEEHAQTVAKQVIDEFVDSLEELRSEENIEDFVLAGHSLGGYLVGKYALKYPQHVKGLVLISPAGVEERPAKSEQLEDVELDWRIRLMKGLWQCNVTPQSLIRIAGMKGPQFIETAIKRRFSERWQGEEAQLISDYMYHITAAPGNGEYCLNALLEPIFLKASHPSATATTADAEATNKSRKRTGVFAKLPLQEELKKLQVPMLLIFGDHDWLYYPSAPDTIKLWKQEGIAAELCMIPQAGHHLYLENAKYFNQQVVDWSKRMIESS